MLSDAISELRGCFESGVRNVDHANLLLTLQTFEMEARNMEDRIAYLTGRPHAPLHGRLISTAAPVIEIGGVRHE